MPRKARRESSTGLYHIMIRGNNRSWIFQKEYFKKVMIKLILKQEKDQLLEMYAWCIMDNHVHIVIRATKEKMAKAMWHINRLFARAYNYKENKVGHVFESRFKSEAIESERYLLQVIRYVHMNPVKAKIVPEPNSYGWSSYRSYKEGLMNRKAIDILEAYFNGRIESFEAYHNEIDETEFLDIREDIEKIRLDKAQRIISESCQRYNITNINELNQNIELRDMILTQLIVESKLTITKIANLSGLSYSAVQRMKKEIVAE